MSVFRFTPYSRSNCGCEVSPALYRLPVHIYILTPVPELHQQRDRGAHGRFCKAFGAWVSKARKFLKARSEMETIAGYGS